MKERSKGVSFTCSVPRVIVNQDEKAIKLTFREMQEADLLDMLSGAISAFNRLLVIRAKEAPIDVEDDDAQA